MSMNFQHFFLSENAVYVHLLPEIWFKYYNFNAMGIKQLELNIFHLCILHDAQAFYTF